MKNIRIYKGLKGNIFFNSSGILYSKNELTLLNKFLEGYIFIYNKKTKNLKGLWLFPNYFNIFLFNGILILRPRNKVHNPFFLSFFKLFYKEMYFFHGFYEETLHFVGVGYKIRFYRRKKKLKTYLWVGFCTWQILKFRPKTIRKFVHESFRLLSLQIFSQNKNYFRKILLMIKNIRPSEPYKGKGIRFLDEKVKRKPGKTGRI